MASEVDLICAYGLDGSGKGTWLDWQSIARWPGSRGALWVHLDAKSDGVDHWLRDKAGLDPVVVDALLASETRPRCEPFAEGVLLILRGVNLNPGADPEDMVSIRIWADAERVISTRLRHLMAVEDVRGTLEAGKGPVSTGDLVGRLAARLIERMEATIEELGDRVAGLEEHLVGTELGTQSIVSEVRLPLVQLRRVAITLRRYLAPQREALNRLASGDEDWLDARVRGRLRETVDRVTRITEELDQVRERSAVVQDELANRLSQRMERTMYVLTLVSAIMLPLGFLTGLLGINVAGIPGADIPWAFWGVLGLLAIIVGVELWILRRFKWL